MQYTKSVRYKRISKALESALLVIGTLVAYCSVVPYDLDTGYLIRDTGKVLLDFYERNNYVPGLWVNGESLIEEKGIDLGSVSSVALGSTLGIGGNLIQYEICFTQETTYLGKDSVPAEAEFPFGSEMTAVALIAPLGAQYDEGYLSISNSAGMSIAVDNDECIDLPMWLRSATDDRIRFRYDPQQLFHREVFDQMKSADQLVEYKQTALGKHFIGAFSDRVTIWVRPKHLLIWHPLLYLVSLIAVLKGYQSLREGLFVRSTDQGK